MAFGAIVLMVTFLRETGIDVEPIHVALWGIPTAISAFVIHGWRMHRLDKTLDQELGNGRAAQEIADEEAVATKSVEAHGS